MCHCVTLRCIMDNHRYHCIVFSVFLFFFSFSMHQAHATYIRYVVLNPATKNYLFAFFPSFLFLSDVPSAVNSHTKHRISSHYEESHFCHFSLCSRFLGALPAICTQYIVSHHITSHKRQLPFSRFFLFAIFPFPPVSSARYLQFAHNALCYITSHRIM